MKVLTYLFPALLVAGTFLHGAPRRYEEDLSITVKETRDSLDDLRREISNHEAEIRTFEQKISTQEDIVDVLRKELKEGYSSQKEQIKHSQGSYETKLTSLESASKGLSADLKQIKSHSLEMQESLRLVRDRMTQLEKTTDLLSRNLENLQNAMGSLTEVVKVSAGIPSVTPSDAKTYKVKAGDSLEKIARLHGTTIKMIKEINHLTKDQIVVGQTLKIVE